MDICFAVNKDYIAQLDVTLTSIFCNKNTNDELNIYILTDNLKENIKQFFIRKYKQIKFIEIDEARFKDYPLVTQSSLSVYYRLILPSLFPQLDKILYLDCDLVVTSSLKDLYHLEIEDYLLAAVEDIGIPKYLPHHLTKLDINKYFNAGILLLNLEKLRTEDFENKFHSYIQKNNTNLLFQDQDVLNVLCQNNVLFIDSKYNQQITPQNQDSKQCISTILHYAGSKKPWNFIWFSTPYSIYWKYVAKSHFKFYFIKTFLSALNKNLKLFIKYLIKENI